MPLPWFRMHHEFATDPKVQMLSEIDQRRYLMILCLRCCNGDVTLQDEEIAFQLRITLEEWRKSKDTLMQKNMVDDDNTPTSWEKRQYESDSSTARVAKHRNNKKDKESSDETLQKQFGNAIDTDTDTDKNNNIDFDSPSKPKSDYDSAFLTFYEAYPIHLSKSQAYRAWKKKKPDLNVCLSAIDAQKKWRDSRNVPGVFTAAWKHPATWLNGECWEDELDAVESDKLSGMPDKLRQFYDSNGNFIG